MIWFGHVKHVAEKTNTFKDLVRKREGYLLRRRPAIRWDYNIKMYLQRIEREVADWIDLAQDMQKWRPQKSAFCRDVRYYDNLSLSFTSLPTGVAKQQ